MDYQDLGCESPMIIQLATVDIFYLLNIGGPPIALATWIHHFDSATLIQLTLVSAGHRYQGAVVMLHIYHFHQLIFSTCQIRIGGPPIPMEFRDIVLVTYILSADCVSLSADPIFFGLFHRPLSADRSLLSEGYQ